LAEPDVIRFYPEARTAHLERAAEMAPATTMYLHARGDFDRTLAEGRPDFQQVSFLRLVARVVRSPPRVLEVPEPMWFRYSPHVIVLLWCLALVRPLRQRRTRVVSYVIENSPVDRRPRPLARFPRFLWLIAARSVVALQAGRLDKVVFGTAGARATLMAAVTDRQRKRLARISRTIEAVPSACGCLSEHAEERRTNQVLFLGALEHRKGVDILLDAWTLVQKELPESRLTIGGKGPMADLVSSRVDGDSSINFVRDAARNEVHAMLRAAQVVVLLSQPSGRWREQVGLPLVEGVAHGCRIVTTDESGMAGWLRDQGQTVIAAPTPPLLAAEALVEVMRSANHNPRYALADVDGRLEADAWLLGDW
jgi:glycosyltransferase involved in cell wall biosynthesis